MMHFTPIILYTRKKTMKNLCTFIILTSLICPSAIGGPVYLSISSVSKTAYGDWDISSNYTGGYIGPVPTAWSNPSRCWGGSDGSTLGYCGDARDAYWNSTGNTPNGSVRCGYVREFLSVTNKRTGKSLGNGKTSYAGAIKIGSAMNTSDAGGESLFGNVAPSSSQTTRQDAMCSYKNAGATMPNPSNKIVTFTLKYDDFTPGDTLTFCTKERYQNWLGQVYDQTPNGSLQKMVAGNSFCIDLNTTAPTCEYVGETNLDMGTIGKNTALTSSVSGQVSCGGGSSIVALSLVQTRPDGVTPLREENGSGGEVNSKISLVIDNQKYNTTTWSGVVNGTKNIQILSEIANSGGNPGTYSGQIVLFLNQL